MTIGGSRWDWFAVVHHDRGDRCPTTGAREHWSSHCPVQGNYSKQAEPLGCSVHFSLLSWDFMNLGKPGYKNVAAPFSVHAQRAQKYTPDFWNDSEKK
jgi:hypothetical protein